MADSVLYLCCYQCVWCRFLHPVWEGRGPTLGCQQAPFPPELNDIVSCSQLSVILRSVVKVTQ
uniref:Uncharacterized protein n=1 Tax=Anguilla anguilla TaxID=7936 RepID=A0A0E9W8E6_ANGAN